MDYIQSNREHWNKRTEIHVGSEFYNVPAFLNGKTSLNEIELKLLGDVKGKRILHLQCHFGQDSISLAHMGAEVTGADLSDNAITEAIKLNEAAGSNCRFIRCDVFELPSLLHEKFDIVFTTYGTIGWLPDMDKWASVVSHFLKEGGRFVFAEFHPFVWMYNNDFTGIEYSYFTSDEIVEEETGTYADRDAPIQSVSITWNHSLSEVINSLLKKHLLLLEFNEYDYSPYNCFRQMIENEPGRFTIQPFGNKVPLVYSLLMEKK